MRPVVLKSEDCIARALDFKTRSEFAHGDNPAYNALWRRGLLDQACSHMKISEKYSQVRWTPEDVFAEALKYQSRAEFKRECSGGHGYALANGYLDQCCSHMLDGKRLWHVFELMAVAIKYSNRSEFRKSEPQAYGFCTKNGLVGVICAHMDKPHSWTKPDVMAVAAKCISIGEFLGSYSGAYKHADRNGYIAEACAHMPASVYGFSKEKPAILYFLRIVAADGYEVFKVGITNRESLIRIAGMGLREGVRAEVLSTVRFESGRDARIAEKRLHRRFASHKYSGPPLMKNGNTELFTVNVFES